MADTSPSGDNAGVAQADEDSQAHGVPTPQDLDLDHSGVDGLDVPESQERTPEPTDDDSLFGDDGDAGDGVDDEFMRFDDSVERTGQDQGEDDAEVDDDLAPIEDLIGQTDQDHAEEDIDSLHNTDREMESQVDTQDLGMIDDMDVDQDGLPDSSHTPDEVHHQDQYSEEHEGLHPVRDHEGNSQEHRFTPQGQEHVHVLKDSQHSQDEQQRPRASVRSVFEAPEINDLAPTVQIGTNGNIDDEDSLFIPDERVPSLTPDFGRAPSTPGLFDRQSGTSGLSSSRIPANSNFATGSASSRKAPKPSPAGRPAAKSSASTYSKIRTMQKRFSQSRAAASRPTQLAQPAPGRETYLDAILSQAPGRNGAPGAEEDEHDKADREARAKYQKLSNHYENIRKKNGKLNYVEDIKWMKIHSAEIARRRKRKRDQDIARQDNGEPYSFTDTYGSRSGLGDNFQEGDMIDDDPAVSSRRPEPPSRPAFPSLMEAELQSLQVALQANKDKPRKKKKTSRTLEDAQQTGRGRSRTKGAKSKASPAAPRTQAKAGTRKTAKDKKAAEHATRLHHSLMHSNVFRQQASADAPAQPTFTSTIKADALKELIASVPNEHQKSVKDDTAALLRATKDFDGHGSCKADGHGMWKVRGMATSLKHYQVMGTAFMRRRENDDREPRGGLMADQMGLGKTLMMLANIVNGSGNLDADCKTTLLVASPALLTQWSREIDLHTDCGLTVLKHMSGSRVESNRAFEIFKEHDIILTTYHEVLRSYPKYEPPEECQTEEEKTAWWEKVYEENRGPLHRMMFHRIVLDEAQAIKNHLSRTSLACRALMARHKWAISGTPVLNGLDELYSYFKFLCVPHTGSFEVFTHNYTDPKDPDSTERLLIRLAQFMIRRDHSDIMMNAPILKLPRASQMTHWCRFNSVERNIYEVVRQRFLKRMEASLKANDSEKSYSNGLVMLLRLRQLTAHILMLQLVVTDLLEQEDIEKIREVVQQEATDQQSSRGKTILAIRRQLDHLEAEAKKQSAHKATVRPPASKRPLASPDDQRDIDELLEENQGNDGGAGASGRSFGKSFDFRPYLNSLTTGDNWEKVKKKTVCSSCRSPPLGAWLTNCGHILCSWCYDNAVLEAAEQGKTGGTCAGCESVFTHANEIQGDSDKAMNGPVTRSRNKQLSREMHDIEQQDIAEEWLSFGGEGVLPSAKTIALKAQLLNWFKENPNVKVIVYTQFLAMIRIIRKMCDEEHWGAEEYHGKMSQRARDKAIGHFADNGGIRVLLASLRCGGLGLNLTMASRVVILDPWWNSASEQQAFCRVFRFGQTEPTCLTRFCVRNTVDERLIQMQERKEREIDSVMKEDAGARASKMGIRDLMRLFGNIREDEGGPSFIIPDESDPGDGGYEDYADEG